MDRRYTRVYIMFMVVNTVSSQEKVEGFTQGAALLPCIYNDIVVEEFNIFWRDKNERNVYDVVNGEADVSSQFSLYSNRVTVVSPQEYPKGNFSLLLKDLKVTDSGRYTCFIPEVNILRQVDLTVKARADKPNLKEEDNLQGSSSVRGPYLSLLLFLPLLQMLLPN